MRGLIRNVAMPVALAVGLDRVLLARGGRGLLNIMYHGVVERDTNWFSPRHLVSGVFDRELAYIVSHFDVVSIEDAFRMRREGAVPRRPTITISFDDGYVNNLHVALPLIERYGVPVTIFALGTCARTDAQRVLWADLVTVLCREHTAATFNVLGRSYGNAPGLRGHRCLFDDLKHAAADERDQALALLDRQFGLHERLKALEEHIWRLMDPHELKRIASSDCISIGSHGLGHYNLGNIASDVVRRDLRDSKMLLENVVGSPVTALAYPDGSYSDSVKDIAEEEGFAHQLAVDLRCASDAGDGRIMPRHGMPSTTSYASSVLFMNHAFGTRGVL